MSEPDRLPGRYRTSTLWVLAIAIVMADAAVLWVGLTYGLVGIVVAILVILSTQRRADAFWRAHNATTRESIA